MLDARIGRKCWSRKYFGVLDTFLIFFVSSSIASLSIQSSESDERHERVTATAVLRKGKKMSRAQLMLENSMALMASHGQTLNCVNKNKLVDRTSVEHDAAALSAPLSSL